MFFYLFLYFLLVSSTACAVLSVPEEAVNANQVLCNTGITTEDTTGKVGCTNTLAVDFAKMSRTEKMGITMSNNESKRASGAENAEDCFPARALAQVNGRFVRLDALRVGDRVSTGEQSQSYVFFFSQAAGEGVYAVVRLCSDIGALTVSPGRLVYTDHGPIPAATVKRGDYLRSANGSFAMVNAVWRAFDHGMYNPQTLNGDIVIDGFVVSTHTQPELIKTAAALLSPVRAAYVAMGIEDTEGLVEGDVLVRNALVPALRAVMNFQKV